MIWHTEIIKDVELVVDMCVCKTNFAAKDIKLKLLIIAGTRIMN